MACFKAASKKESEVSGLGFLLRLTSEYLEIWYNCRREEFLRIVFEVSFGHLSRQATVNDLKRRSLLIANITSALEPTCVGNRPDEIALIS